ncbi:hypothetical protein DITRI_Ditri02bG0154200 [Diplodiscus trichospermus]
MIKKTTSPPVSSGDCCIYRVSQSLRKGNEFAYTPQIVSIGPLHHRDEHLKRMKEVKVRYLEQFLRHAADTANFSKFPDCGDQKARQMWQCVDDPIRNNFSCLDEFLGILQSSEQKIRQSYAEDLSYLTSEELLKIILVDAALIIELFLRFYFGSIRDTILSTTYVAVCVRIDLWLLENQVPFFVLEDLYNAAFGSHGMTIYPSFLNLACKFFRVYDKQNWEIERKVKHFTDLRRTSLLPIPEAEEKRSNAEDQKQPSDERGPLKELLKSATQLHAAGVKFRENKSSNC